MGMKAGQIYIYEKKNKEIYNITIEEKFGTSHETQILIDFITDLIV